MIDYPRHAAEWIWLQEIVKGVRFQDKIALLNCYHDPSEVFCAPGQDLLSAGVTPEVYDAFFTHSALDQAKLILDNHEQLGIQMITRQSKAFRGGNWLVLYYKGNIRSGLASTVVGTRQCTRQGLEYTRIVCQDLVKNGVIINSGLALGIDQQAHCTAIDSGGHTQAFVAHGLDRCYPRQNAFLMAAIIENGAVISPFFSGIRPYRHHFAMRNALMCAWSDEVIVTEASENSGAMMTAEFARRMGKPVRTVVPTPLGARCAGNRKLLETGAQPFLLADGASLPDPAPSDEIVQLLASLGPMPIDDLADRLNQPFRTIEEHLLQLSIAHWIYFAGDGRWHYNGW